MQWLWFAPFMLRRRAAAATFLCTTVLFAKRVASLRASGHSLSFFLSTSPSRCMKQFKQWPLQHHWCLHPWWHLCANAQPTCGRDSSKEAIAQAFARRCCDGWRCHGWCAVYAPLAFVSCFRSRTQKKSFFHVFRKMSCFSSVAWLIDSERSSLAGLHWLQRSNAKALDPHWPLLSWHLFRHSPHLCCSRVVKTKFNGYGRQNRTLPAVRSIHLVWLLHNNLRQCS